MHYAEWAWENTEEVADENTGDGPESHTRWEYIPENVVARVSIERPRVFQIYTKFTSLL